MLLAKCKFVKSESLARIMIETVLLILQAASRPPTFFCQNVISFQLSDCCMLASALC